MENDGVLRIDEPVVAVVEPPRSRDRGIETPPGILRPGLGRVGGRSAPRDTPEKMDADGGHVVGKVQPTPLVRAQYPFVSHLESLAVLIHIVAVKKSFALSWSL